MYGVDPRPSMVARRRLFLPLVAAAVTTLFAGVAAAARSIALPGRPSASGTSATRCAQCGATDHTMLDPRCPAAPRVL
jgi:hypothetical protein